jgi:hypothetical protein
MKRRINHNKQTKLRYMPDKIALQIAIKVAKGFADPVDYNYFPNRRGAE